MSNLPDGMSSTDYEHLGIGGPPAVLLDDDNLCDRCGKRAGIRFAGPDQPGVILRGCFVCTQCLANVEERRAKR